MSRRDQIRLSDEEIRSFLTSCRTIIICSNSARGFPHPMPMWFALDDDGAIRMTTFRKSQKVKNIQRDPRVTLLAEDGREYSKLRGVVLYGTCEIVDDIEVVKDTMVRITTGEAGGDPAALEGMKNSVAAAAQKRVCLLIRPERVVSWDHRKLGGTY
jgi:nitroimidazol reductase NimA-like FMN-containing flavoprotein (pyridoxamine 5'-phosphate oxidase superfamily)